MSDNSLEVQGTATHPAYGAVYLQGATILAGSTGNTVVAREACRSTFGSGSGTVGFTNVPACIIQ
jgi:hypothetical protein